MNLRDCSNQILYYSPLTNYGITPLKKQMFLDMWERGDELPEEEWDTLALVREEQFFDDEIDIEDVFGSLEEGARQHGSRLCAAVLGAGILGTYTRRAVVADGFSWLTRAFHEGVENAAYPLAAWYANRALMRDLPDFEDVDLGLTSCYDPTPDCPPVPFPRNRAECLDRALFWTLTGLANEIDECGRFLYIIAAPDELYDKYEDLLRKAAARSSLAKTLLATNLFRDGTSAEQHAEAIGLLRDAAKEGTPRETYLLAKALKDTVGELPDSTPEEAFQLCLKAAEGGEPSAMRDLSVYYGTGIGTEKNQDLAARWLAEGAHAGSGECQYLVGTLLLDAATTPKERRVAVNWIRMAAEENDMPEAWVTLARHYETGDGLYKSKKQAHYCRKRAAELGWNPDSDPIKKLH